MPGPKSRVFLLCMVRGQPAGPAAHALVSMLQNAGEQIGNQPQHARRAHGVCQSFVRAELARLVVLVAGKGNNFCIQSGPRVERFPAQGEQAVVQIGYVCQ